MGLVCGQAAWISDLPCRDPQEEGCRGRRPLSRLGCACHLLWVKPSPLYGGVRELPEARWPWPPGEPGLRVSCSSWGSRVQVLPRDQCDQDPRTRPTSPGSVSPRGSGRAHAPRPWGDAPGPVRTAVLVRVDTGGGRQVTYVVTSILWFQTNRGRKSRTKCPVCGADAEDAEPVASLPGVRGLPWRVVSPRQPARLSPAGGAGLPAGGSAGRPPSPGPQR